MTEAGGLGRFETPRRFAVRVFILSITSVFILPQWWPTTTAVDKGSVQRTLLGGVLPEQHNDDVKTSLRVLPQVKRRRKHE